MAFLPTNPFIQIINKKLPANIVFEDENVIAFKDIAPKAKIHVLICPKEEIVTAMDINQENKAIFAELFVVAKKVAQKLNLEGYKLHMNVGEKGGQIVPHVHLHLLSADFKTQL